THLGRLALSNPDWRRRLSSSKPLARVRGLHVCHVWAGVPLYVVLPFIRRQRHRGFDPAYESELLLGQRPADAPAICKCAASWPGHGGCTDRVGAGGVRRARADISPRVDQRRGGLNQPTDQPTNGCAPPTTARHWADPYGEAAPLMRHAGTVDSSS